MIERLILAKANDRERETATFQIQISDPLPEFTGLDFEARSKAFYETEADRLHDVLRQCLPGGTVEQLLIALLKSRANLWRPSLAQCEAKLHTRKFAIAQTTEGDWRLREGGRSSISLDWDGMLGIAASIITNPIRFEFREDRETEWLWKREIRVQQIEHPNHWRIAEADQISDDLNTGEAIGLICSLTIPLSIPIESIVRRPCLQWMKKAPPDPGPIDAEFSVKE